MLSRLIPGFLRWSVLLWVPGGILWMLSPLGVYLSEYRYSTAAVFWKLFPAAPALILLGLIGLYAWFPNRPGWSMRVGYALAFAGLLLILFGDVGKYWLGLDDVYLMTAPAYRAMRLGLLVLAGGTMLLGFGAARSEAVPVWAALPLAIAGLAGLISFSQDLASFGAALWIFFGFAWVLLGLSLLTTWFVASRRKRRVS